MTQPKRVGDLVVAAALKRGAEHHLALEFRKRCQTGERGTDLEPPLDFVLGVAGLAAVLDVERVVYRTAELADRDVVDDPVQPRPGVTYLDPGLPRATHACISACCRTSSALASDGLSRRQYLSSARR